MNEKGLFRGFESNRMRRFLLVALIGLSLVGVLARFYHIREPQFFYYDEGLYLDHSRGFVSLVENSRPHGLVGNFNALFLLARVACASNKVLWYFLAGLRPFFMDHNSLVFTRLVSAISGTLTLFLVFLFTQKITRCRLTAFLSVVILALLPSHLYYSRLGLQETFSAFCFIAGVYTFCFSRRFFIKSFVSGFLFACVYFTNYRMIILPVFMIALEGMMALSENKAWEARKLLWSLLTFFSCVFLVGDCFNGINSMATFGWMFHQADLAQGHFSVMNLLSYPYYVFHLEGIIFGLLLFGGLMVLFHDLGSKETWRRRVFAVIPLVLVLLQMTLFSFPQEKGVRYICVVMPLMAVSVAGFIHYLYRYLPLLGKKVLVGILVVMAVQFIARDVRILSFHSDYKTVIDELSMRDPKGRVMTTQPLVQSLFVVDKNNVVELPRTIEQLMAYYGRGYRYLILCPQSYISYTADGKRFSLLLEGPLQFVLNYVKPLKVYPHFNQRMLDRFVLEHNENLLRSLHFIRSNKQGELGALRIYDVGQIMASIQKLMERQTKESHGKT